MHKTDHFNIIQDNITYPYKEYNAYPYNGNIYPTYQYSQPITTIYMNGFYSFNDKNVKIQTINGKTIKGKVINQQMLITSNLLDIKVISKNKEIVKSLMIDKILLIELDE